MAFFHKETSAVTAEANSNVYVRVKKDLFAWQKECLDIWFDNQGKWVVNVVTGAGKTILALGAIARLEYNYAEQAPFLKIKIVVPKVFLANQWVKSLQDDLGVSKGDIGLYYGMHKDPQSRKYMICLLYTSDAADEEDSVDLGGRRIIKKKKKSIKNKNKK